MCARHVSLLFSLSLELKDAAYVSDDVIVNGKFSNLTHVDVDPVGCGSNEYNDLCKSNVNVATSKCRRFSHSI